MHKYYQDTVIGGWFVDPILENNPNLAVRTEAQFNARVGTVTLPTVAQLLATVTHYRKKQEIKGVTINGIRYAGDPSNRQAMQESLAFMEDSGLAEFTSWKDSDDVFHANHPLADVSNAYRAIGARRLQLIEAESEYAEQINAGTLTDLTALLWP